MKIAFTKISATGNDFIVFDNRTNDLSAGRHHTWFQQICRRRLSIGADGVILLESSSRADFRYIHINSDGNEAEMCGNGTRAISMFAFKNKIAGQNLKFEINGSVYEASVADTRVTTQFKTPNTPQFNLGILSENNFEEGGFINTGVPHYVLFSRDIDKIDVATQGAFYRHHKVFAPNGVNVNFAEVIDSHSLYVRTFERGVEGETMACGTGAVATAFFSILKKNCSPPITVQTRGGELVINSTESLTDITLSGTVNVVFEGLIDGP